MFKVFHFPKDSWHSRMLRQTEELGDMYLKCCRSILEFAVPSWHSAITAHESNCIERVQKMAIHIILGDRYRSYETTLGEVGLETF